MLLVTNQRLDSLKRLWEQRYNELKEYVEKNDRYPSSKDDFILHKWVSNQKLYYQKKRLSEDRVIKLSELKRWKWYPEKVKNKWMVKYEELKHFIDLHKRCPKSNEEDIGAWVVKQRYMYGENKLSEERIALLSKLDGWKWYINEKNNTWNKNFNKLKYFVFIHKRLPKYNYNSVEENELYNWVLKQQDQYAKRTLSIDRQIHLEDIQIWKWLSDSDFNNTLRNEVYFCAEQLINFSDKICDDLPIIGDKKRNKMDISYILNDNQPPPAKRQKINL